jgi:hypothetical protein
MMISGFVTGERPVLESCSCLCAARKSKLLDKCNGKATEKQTMALGTQDKYNSVLARVGSFAMASKP